MNNIPFLQKVDNLGQWDIPKVINDIRNLFQLSGCNWDTWQRNNKLTHGQFVDSKLHDNQGYLNLTYNPGLSNSIEDRLWSFSGRKFQERNDVADGDLHTLQPELAGTYIEELFKKLTQELGPVRLRLHNKADQKGLYWHRDEWDDVSQYRYHLTLWTNPGHFIVWTKDEFTWQYGFDPRETKKDIKINAEYMPVNGNIFQMATGVYLHGVSSIAIGWNASHQMQSRCHLVAIPMVPNNRHFEYTYK